MDNITEQRGAAPPPSFVLSLVFSLVHVGRWNAFIFCSNYAFMNCMCNHIMIMYHHFYIVACMDHHVLCTQQARLPVRLRSFTKPCHSNGQEVRGYQGWCKGGCCREGASASWQSTGPAGGMPFGHRRRERPGCDVPDPTTATPAVGMPFGHRRRADPGVGSRKPSAATPAVGMPFGHQRRGVASRAG